MKKIAMIFAGQGSQATGMGKDFYENSAVAKEMFEAAGKRVGLHFDELIFGEHDLLGQTAYTQPSILLVQMIAYCLFKERCPQLKAELFLGHSLGEFSALCASGAIDYVDAIELVHRRGQLMQDACSEIEAGMMVVMGLEDEAVERICAHAQEEGKKVWPANYNQDGQLVVAGMKSDLASLEQVFKDAGAKRALLLNMSVASHCELLSAAQAPLKSLMESMISDTFEAPVISNVTMAPYASKKEAVGLLSEQLIKPVKYKQSIEAIAKDVDIAIEFGNGATLKGLNKRIAPNLETYTISDMKSLDEVVTLLCN